jgi:hypothetical protein
VEHKTIFNNPEKKQQTREEVANYFKAPDYGAKFREMGKKIFGSTESEARASENPQSEAIKQKRYGK